MRQSIIRALSSSASRQAAPIPVFGIAGNYAQAVYGAADKKGAKDAVAKDLAALQGALANSKVSDYMSDPFVDSGKKLAILGDVAKAQSMSPLVVNLFSVLADNHRLNLVAEISEVYARIMQAESGFTPVNVTSAVELSKSQQKEIGDAVAAIVGGGNVEVGTSVNPDIVGGLVVSIGDKYTEMKHIDLSTSSKMKKYTALLHKGL